MISQVLSQYSPTSAPRKKIHCQLCGSAAVSRQKFPERLDNSPPDFSARKAQRRNHFRIMECRQCGLVYSDGIFTDDYVAQLYRAARFIEEPQLSNMRLDYLRALQQVISYGGQKGDLLEVGCANGFFLKAAKELGFKQVVGVEPGADAVASALPEIRPCIVNDLFQDGLFNPDSFDVVCSFQVIDHLISPVNFLKSAWRVLRPGGIILIVNHDIRSFWPKLMGEWSPMYDIEHIFLFDKKTLSQALEKVGFEIKIVSDIPNSYTFSYCLKMFPLPHALRVFLLRLLQRLSLGNLNLRLPAGNMMTIARKPYQVNHLGCAK